MCHGLSHFDGHLIIDAIANDRTHIRQISNIVAKNKETYISFTVEFLCSYCIERREKEGEEEEEETERECTGDGFLETNNDSDDEGGCFCNRIQKCQFKVSKYTSLGARMRAPMT